MSTMELQAMTWWEKCGREVPPKDSYSWFRMLEMYCHYRANEVRKADNIRNGGVA